MFCDSLARHHIECITFSSIGDTNALCSRGILAHGLNRGHTTSVEVPRRKDGVFIATLIGDDSRTTGFPRQ